MSVNTNVMKKFLGDVKAKGLEVCEGITVGPNADVFIAETGGATAMTSFVKETTMVFGTLDAGTFTASADPASPAATDKYYLKLVRGRGDVEYKAVRGLNDLISKDGESISASVDSIQDLLDILAQLDTEVSQAIEDAHLASWLDGERLETVFDMYIVQLKADLNDMRDDLIAHANDRDAEILAALGVSLESRRVATQRVLNLDGGAILMSYGTLSTFSGQVCFRPIDSADAERKLIENWMVKVHTHEAGSGSPDKVINDSVLFSAQILDNSDPDVANALGQQGKFWQEEEKKTIGMTDQGYGEASHMIKVSIDADSCDAFSAAESAHIAAYYVGDLSSTDAPIDGTPDFSGIYNGGVLADIGKPRTGSNDHGGTLIDSDVDQPDGGKIEPRI